MAAGKPPFRAQNHIELLKKIDSSNTIKFPDEDPAMHQRAQTKDEELKTVLPDIKMLIRILLKAIPAERSSFDEFFASTAMVKSKFPRPREPTPLPNCDDDDPDNIPEHYRRIPSEVVDPKALIAAAKTKFMRRTSHGVPESALHDR